MAASLVWISKQIIHMWFKNSRHVTQENIQHRSTCSNCIQIGTTVSNVGNVKRVAIYTACIGLYDSVLQSVEWQNGNT